MSVQTTINELMRDPTVSIWLKAALETTGIRDPVDALADVELLHEICATRVIEAEAEDLLLNEVAGDP